MNRRVYSDSKTFFEQNRELGTGLPYTEDVSVLGEALAIGSRTAPNRIA